MADLFNKNVIKDKLQKFEIPNFKEKIKVLENWNKLYKEWKLQEKKEVSLQWEFAQHILWTVLDYQDMSENTDEWNRQNEPWSPTWWQSADFWLWYFKSSSDFSQNIVKAVIEVKDAKTSLDKPQKREWNLTPIQQAFKYKPYFKECDFVLVSNFYEIRLYTDSYYDFESWNLTDLLNPEDNYFNFRKFYYLLCKNNFIAKWESNTKHIISAIKTREKEITKKFYKEYSELRKKLIKDIVINKWDRKLPWDFILEKAQKIIDRIIFIHFCEDLDLLPNWKLWENLLRAEEIDFTPWEMLKRFFRLVDKWSEKLWIPDWYNWWLFHKDEELDSLVVWDEICKEFVKLWEYDFSEDLSVNILWHIFEQSISDIEEIKWKIKQDWNINSASKRKKDWVFYTPEYIVDYIVKNSVWKYLEEIENSLKEKHWLKEDLKEETYNKRIKLVYDEYLVKLQNIKVLDPACGSWAFLVNVFDILLAENKRVWEIFQSAWINSFETEENYVKNKILQNNIYWVDLNPESVEITKLSLWLKTAIKWKKLANLDWNIKCWNSLIDDVEIAWDKAFSWEKEFKEISEGWGFDVVVGNPPYVVVKNNEEVSKVYEWNDDLYLMFFEQSFKKLLKKEVWYFWFITPRFFLVNKNCENFRKFLLNEVNLIRLVETSPFEDANTECVITIVNLKEKNECIDIFHDLWQNIEFRNSLNKEMFKNTDDYLINTSLDVKSFNILNKIELNSVKLSDISKSKRWMEIWKSALRELTKWEKTLIWQDVNKYSLSFEETFISNENKECKRLLEFFKWESIYLRRVAKELIAYAWLDFAYNKNLYWIKIQDSKFNQKFILSLLNSKLLTYYYKVKFSTKKWDLFPEIQSYLYNQLPIKNISPEDQKPFIEKAEKMLELNKNFQEKISEFLKFLEQKFSLEKISQKLKKFFELDFSEFKKQLKIKKISLDEEMELQNFFNKKKDEVLVLKGEIDKTDLEIDEMVFELYGLSGEERKIVLKS